MKKVRVTLAPVFGFIDLLEEVTAYDFGVLGLVVHRALVFSKGGPKLSKNRWNITHIRSGLRIGDFFPTRREAIAFGERISGLLDWTLAESGIRYNVFHLRDLIAEIRKRRIVNCD